jgi:hypothetical protein
MAASILIFRLGLTPVLIGETPSTCSRTEFIIVVLSLWPTGAGAGGPGCYRLVWGGITDADMRPVTTDMREFPGERDIQIERNSSITVGKARTARAASGPPPLSEGGGAIRALQLQLDRLPKIISG